MHALQVTAAASGLLCARCPAAMNVLIVLPGALDTLGGVERGDVVPVRFGKWGGRPHWEMDLRYLGADQFGDWLGSPAGMPMRRPGWTTRTDAECAFLVPVGGRLRRVVQRARRPDRDLRRRDRHPSLGRRDRPRRGPRPRRRQGLGRDRAGYEIGHARGREFAEHQVQYGYPPEVVDAAQRSCDDLVTAIAGDQEPWASVGHAWCAQAVDLPLAPLPDWAEPA